MYFWTWWKQSCVQMLFFANGYIEFLHSHMRLAPQNDEKMSFIVKSFLCLLLATILKGKNNKPMILVLLFLLFCLCKEYLFVHRK